MAYGEDQGGLLPQAFGDPAKQGLLAAGLAILANSRGPNSGNAIGAGGLAGLQAFQQAQSVGDMQAYRQAQIAKLQQDAEKQKAILGMLNRLSPQGGGGTGAGAPMAGDVPGASPSAMPGGAQGFPLSLHDVTALKLAGVDVFDQYKYAKDGVKREAGATYINPVTGEQSYTPKVDNGMSLVYGPNGATVVALPGYSQANAANKAAEAGAVAHAQGRYTTTPIPTGKGGSRTVLTSDLPTILGQGGGGLGNTPSPADMRFEETVAGASAETYNTLQKAGLNADKQISNYQRIGSLLDGYEGGSLSGIAMSGAKFLNSLDIKLDPKLPDKEAAAAIGNQLALQLRDPANGGGMPGAMSDADRNFLLQTVPNLNQTNTGRKQLIDYNVKVLQRNKDVSMFARKWRQKYGRLDALDTAGNDFQTALSRWAQSNPLFGDE